MDDFAALNAFPTLTSLLTSGRKYGAACVVGTQSISLIRERYGHAEAETILSSCSTVAAFRAPNVDTAEWLSKNFGECEKRESPRAVTYLGHHSDNFMQGAVPAQPIVHPSKLIGLPDRECFIKLPGGFPIANTCVALKARREIASPYQPIARDVPKKKVITLAPMPELPPPSIESVSNETGEVQEILDREATEPVPVETKPSTAKNAVLPTRVDGAVKEVEMTNEAPKQRAKLSKDAPEWDWSPRIDRGSPQT